jgi:hypothetical protein
VSKTSNESESFRPGVSIQIQRRATRTVPTTNPRRASARTRVRLRKASAGIRQVCRQLRLRAGESEGNAAGVEVFSSANCPVSSEAGQKEKSTVYDGGLLRKTPESAVAPERSDPSGSNPESAKCTTDFTPRSEMRTARKCATDGHLRVSIGSA